jgi:hypothetical protein
MKLFALLFLLPFSLVGAGNQFAVYDWETQDWAKTRVPVFSSSVRSNEYVATAKFMLKLKQVQLVGDAYTIGRKIKNCGVYLGADLNALRAPLVAPVTYAPTNAITNFVAGDYTATGLTGNTTTKYLASNRSLSQDASIDSVHMAVYVQTASSESSYCMGTGHNFNPVSPNTFSYLAVSYANVSYAHVGDGVNGVTTVADTNGVGLYVCTRTSALAGGVSLYKNGASIATTANAPGGTALPTEPMLIHAWHINDAAAGWTSRTLSFYSWGTGLTATDDLNLYRFVQRLQTVMGRNQ